MPGPGSPSRPVSQRLAAASRSARFAAPASGLRSASALGSELAGGWLGPVPGPGLERVGASLAGPHADDLIDRDRPDLAVADLAGAGRLDQRVDDSRGGLVGDQDLDPDLGDEVDGVLGAAVDLCVAALAAVALDLADGQAGDADLAEGVLDLAELERLDDRGDESHESAPSAGLRAAAGVGGPGAGWSRVALLTPRPRARTRPSS